MLDEILESATAVTSDSEDYRGEDGLLYCGKCHTPREAYFPKGITLLGTVSYTHLTLPTKA